MNRVAGSQGSPRGGGMLLFGSALTVAGGLVLAGCKLGPETERPANVAEESEQFANAEPEQARQMPELDQWWKRFEDPVTNELVATALERNTDLRAAGARLLEARGALGVATGERRPQVQGNFGRNRSQTTFDFGEGRDTAATTTYTLEATVSWQLDLFGRLRRQQEAEGYRFLAAKANREAVAHSVVAEVVRLRARIATLQRRVEITQQRIESFERTHELIQQRQEQDLASGLEVRAARQSLEQSRAQLPELRFQLKSARHGLDVLLGRQPGTGDPLPSDFDRLPPQGPPPVGVPAALLDRRPDLRNSELQVRARQAEVGVAMARLFPDLTINAGAGYESSELDNLIDPQGQVWSLLTQAAMPIFQGAAGEANVERAEAAAEALAADYAGQVLDAMREVEDALARQQTAWARHGHLLQQVEEARQSVKLARQQQEEGLSGLLDLLEVQRRRFDAEVALAEARQTLWRSRIDLFLALGGDWTGSMELENQPAQGSEPADDPQASEGDGADEATSGSAGGEDGGGGQG